MREMCVVCGMCLCVYVVYDVCVIYMYVYVCDVWSLFMYVYIMCVSVYNVCMCGGYVNVVCDVYSMSVI